MKDKRELASRRGFLKGMAMLSALGAPHCKGEEMLPGEQAAYDMYNAKKMPRPDGILAGEPALQAPAPDSMGVAFAVTTLANGFVELADNPEMKKPLCFMAEGRPLARIDERVIHVRLTGLKPGKRYWYRAGAAKIERAVGSWMKPSETVWGKVHSFITPGRKAPSHFAMMNDTHCAFKQMAKITGLYRSLDVPLVVWNGDIPYSFTHTREDLVKNYLLLPENEGFSADTPIALNPGNHEYRGRGALFLDDVVMPRLPTERSLRDIALNRNFAFRMGQIALIGLETGEDKPDHHPANGGYTHFTAHRQAQAKWLKDQFKRREIASAPYVVAFTHIPIVEIFPGANPGTTLVNYAKWQKECADLWGPILTANDVQLVLAAHIHWHKYIPATKERSWAHITGGGTGSWTHQTLVEGKVERGELVVRVHNIDKGGLDGEYRFKPRRRR